MTVEIVSAYVENNNLSPAELRNVIREVHDALKGQANGNAAPAQRPPALAIKRSVTAEHIVCLKCGRKFKSLKRHLSSKHEMTPAAYRDQCSLPHDYPMVAPNYAKARSQLARNMGLGQRRPTGRRPRKPT